MRASAGFPVSYGLSQSLRNSKELSRFPESKRIFLRDGKFYEPGEALLQPELARTLERCGVNDAYRMSVAGCVRDLGLSAATSTHLFGNWFATAA